MAEYKKSGSCKYIIVTGCLSQRYAEELFSELPEADAIAGVEVYDEIGSIIKRVMNGERFIMLERSKPDVIYTSKETFLPRILTTPSYTAYLKTAIIAALIAQYRKSAGHTAASQWNRCLKKQKHWLITA